MRTCSVCGKTRQTRRKYCVANGMCSKNTSKENPNFERFCCVAKHVKRDPNISTLVYLLLETRIRPKCMQHMYATHVCNATFERDPNTSRVAYLRFEMWTRYRLVRGFLHLLLLVRSLLFLPCPPIQEYIQHPPTHTHTHTRTHTHIRIHQGCAMREKTRAQKRGGQPMRATTANACNNTSETRTKERK